MIIINYIVLYYDFLRERRFVACVHYNASFVQEIAVKKKLADTCAALVEIHSLRIYDFVSSGFL